MVCACHRLGLFPMAHTNHTLPTDFSTQLKSTVKQRAFTDVSLNVGPVSQEIWTLGNLEAAS